MKTIGLIGGLSWESSLEYYRIINQLVRERLGGQHSAQLLMYSVDFAPIEQLQQQGAWDEAGHILVDAALSLERGGAELVMLCTNTMHKVAPAIQSAVKLPLLHIATATGERVRAAGLTRIGLLGTRFTMEQDFYTGILRDDFGLDVIIPGETDRAIVHRVIYDELCQGIIRDDSRREYARIMAGLAEQGAQGIVLGCTEITLLVQAGDSPVPTFDTTRIHAEKAVEWALAPVEIG